MAKIVSHCRHGLCFVGPQRETPGAGWLKLLKLQKYPLVPGARWYSLYPLSGGVICAQSSDFKDERDAVEEDYKLACERKFNPAAKTILAL